MKQRGELKFQFDLSNELGLTRKQLLSNMSAQEFSDWMAYRKIEPLYNRRMCYLLAYLVMIQANVNTKKNNSFDIEDFMPEIKEQKETGPEHLAEKARQINKVLGGVEQD